MHLGVLPETRKWREVVDLLDDAAAPDAVIAAAAIAAERDFTRATDDGVFIEAIRLLARLPDATTSADLEEGLGGIGITVPSDPGLIDLVVGLGMRLDHISPPGRGSDFTELARGALLATITREIGAGLPRLLEPTPDDLQIALRRFGRPHAFAALVRAYFTTLLSQTLTLLA